MVSGFFEYNNGKLFYQTTGDGEPLVFLHGFTLDHTMWDEQVKYFSKKYKVITFDMRGFGLSSLPSDKYSYSDDLLALLNHLQIGKVHVVGLSLGGEEALNFAIEHSEKVKTLTLVSSSLGGYASTVDWDVKAESLGVDTAKKNWLSHDVFKSSKNYPEALLKLTSIVNGYSGWHWLNSGYRIRPQIDAIQLLKDVNIPVLIAVGELDLTYYHEISVILEENIRNSKKIVIPSCGHMLTMENHDRFNAELDLFLSSCVN